MLVWVYKTTHPHLMFSVFGCADRSSSLQNIYTYTSSQKEHLAKCCVFQLWTSQLAKACGLHDSMIPTCKWSANHADFLSGMLWSPLGRR